MTRSDKIIRPKVGLLELAKQLGNVSAACRMMGYSRLANVAGGTYFFTVNLAERKRTLLVDHVDLLGAVVQRVKSTHRFQTDAMPILPDQLHAVWTQS